jgi:hypothetical protein
MAPGERVPSILGDAQASEETYGLSD